MVPPTILSRLGSLATRERMLRFVWGTARLLAAAGVLLLLACLTDWVYDLFDETPIWLRGLMTALQLGVAVTLLIVLVVRPLVLWLSYSELAGLVEAAFPKLHGRVRSAVELNAPNAKTAGMSADLIAEVTRQAEQEMRSLPVTQAIDGKRWKWSLAVLAPVLVLLAVPLVVATETSVALALRQLLFPVDIPRSVHIVAGEQMPQPLRAKGIGKTVWPNDDDVQLQFLATGPGAEHAGNGTAVLSGEGLPTEYVELVRLPTQPGVDGVVYQATVKSPGRSFQAKAWIGDGRTKQPVGITLEPRPDLVANEAYLILPAFVGLRPDGKPYEELQDRGDITGFRDCRARIVVTASKPLARATLQLMTPEVDSPHEKESRTLAMQPVDDTRTKWQQEFDLRPGETAYRVLMLDPNGYDNKKIPRRSISFGADEPPQVQLMPERFTRLGQTSFLEDTEVDGLPVLHGKAIRINYRVRTTLALRETKPGAAAASLRYRILKPGSEGRTESIPWVTLPLIEVDGTNESGRYDPLLGKFANGDDKQDIQFAAVASYDPARVRGRRDGGGRFDFKTGTIAELQVGDRIEYYVQVHDSRPGSKPGESEVRVKEVVDGRGLSAWIASKLDEFKRLQQLESRQSGIFAPPNPDSP